MQYVKKENPPTCLLNFDNQSARALLDTGADVSIISSNFFRKIAGNGRLSNAKVKLRVASGAFLKILGCCQLNFKIQGKKYHQNFTVVENLSRDCILGRDFMVKNKCVIALGDGFCKLGDQKVPICELNQVRSIVRLTQDMEIPPYYLKTTFGKYHKKAGVCHNQNITWKQTEQGFLSNEPGLCILNGFGNASPSRRIPLTVVNQTSKWFRLKKGNVVAVIERDPEIFECSQPVAEVKSAKEELTFNTSQGLSDHQKKRLQELLLKNQDIFSQSEFDLGKSNLISCSINTGKSAPICKRPYRTPFAYRAEVKNQIDQMLSLKLISPSNSSWAAPILCVKKKDGGLRICCDYRSLNDVTEKFYWPLPNIDDIFANLGGARYFSSLDFLKAYHQIPMQNSSKEKTAFACEEGLYEYNYMPYGLSCAPSVFQECMSRLLNGMSSFSTAYLDDVLVWSRTFDDHILHLIRFWPKIPSTIE